MASRVTDHPEPSSKALIQAGAKLVGHTPKLTVEALREALTAAYAVDFGGSAAQPGDPPTHDDLLTGTGQPVWAPAPEQVARIAASVAARCFSENESDIADATKQGIAAALRDESPRDD